MADPSSPVPISSFAFANTSAGEAKVLSDSQPAELATCQRTSSTTGLIILSTDRGTCLCDFRFRPLAFTTVVATECAVDGDQPHRSRLRRNRWRPLLESLARLIEQAGPLQ